MSKMNNCSRDELDRYINELLNCKSFTDFAPNGLQVEGTDTIKKICTAVTASDEVIIKAIADKADALIVHHGLFWKDDDAVITGMKRNRLKHLLTNNINLYAYHLPLDCHINLGNNAELAKILDVEFIKMFSVDGIENLIWTGTLKKEFSAMDLSLMIEKKLNRAPLFILGNNRSIKKIAWCSGAAQDYIIYAHRLGVDAYLSGEISERTYYQAQELGINYLSCGHHATERYGIQALGKHLSEQFSLTHKYIESDNPI